jgi:hypothetical protein
LPKIVELKKKSNKTFEMYPNFNDTEREDLKSWNRCAIYFNVVKDIGIEEGQKYARQFPIEERKRMLTIFNMIKEKGMDNVKAMIMRGELAFI